MSDPYTSSFCEGVRDLDHVEREGVRIHLVDDHEVERWDGEVTGDTLRGIYHGADGDGAFALIRMAEPQRGRLDACAGIYSMPGGYRFRISVEPRITDTVLRYFDESTGEDRWLFPTSDSTFIAGPTSEAPLPVEHRARVFVNESGQTALEWIGGAERTVGLRQPLDIDTASVAAYVRDFMQDTDVPGVSLAVVTAEGPIWLAAFGKADREREVPATTSTLYQIGSVTKLFTATLLLQLRDEGRLQLDDPVWEHLPDTIPKPSGDGARGITLRHLLTHTSGLPGNPVNRVDVDGVMQPYGVSELYAGLARTHLQSRPGEEWRYSNLGFGLLGHVVEKAGDGAYESLLRSRLLDPLGMRSTAVHLSENVAARLAVHYWPEDTPRHPRPRWRFGDIAGFGGITSNVEDLSRFLAFAMKAGRPGLVPLRGSTVAEMQTPHFMRPGWNDAMGYAWFVSRGGPSGTLLYHGGEVDGHSSFLAFAPVHDIGVIVLANLGGSTADALGRGLMSRRVDRARRQGLATRREAFDLYLDHQWTDAVWALQPVANARPDDGVVWLRLGISLFNERDLEKAVPVFEHAATLGFFPELAMYYIARMQAIRGRDDSAFVWLQRAVDAGLRGASRLTDVPDFRSLQDDPRFSTILQAL